MQFVFLCLDANTLTSFLDRKHGGPWADGEMASTLLAKSFARDWLHIILSLN